MGHYCDAPNRTIRGDCHRWLVNFDHCKPHRVSVGAGRITNEHSAHSSGGRDHIPVFMADVLVEELNAAMANRVVGYLGQSEAHRLPSRPWDGTSCAELAHTIEFLLQLRRRAGDVVGAAVGHGLPPGTPELHRTLVKGIGARLVRAAADPGILPIARGLQLVGIFQCMIQGLPLSACACLRMFGSQLVAEQITQRLQELLDAIDHDLRDDPRAA
jgi:hypothetical protein